MKVLENCETEIINILNRYDSLLSVIVSEVQEINMIKKTNYLKLYPFTKILPVDCTISTGKLNLNLKLYLPEKYFKNANTIKAITIKILKS